eukprot:gnl/TRDRNA2_/TRDRNA2_81659_c0_seq2.p1 gnl/TRDRNA2_/TRDRNA2_81659_c0~~gnl/TRDRNA2_/TRDRNA2_81659_c0_seq2.p1  ORF type:complete len:690 (+),score=112.82 gnl/TRDRNA2_/TRDRNA2_81659_c0_seq2:226-2295(+)
MYCYAGSYHEGRSGCKPLLLRHPHRLAPKLQAVAEEVVHQRQKAAVLVARGSGYRAMLDVMRQAGAAAKPPFQVASMEELAEFNDRTSNLHGEKLLCLVADASQYTEGVSFGAVRVLHLCDVPPSPTILAQQCGRASRMFGHHGLQFEDQTVTVRLHVAVLPKWARDPLGAWALQTYCRPRHSGLAEQTPAQAPARAKRLLGRLRKSGVESLMALKARVDDFGVVKARKQRLRADPQGAVAERRDGKLRTAHLQPDDVAAFLDSIGLRDEAAAVRCRCCDAPVSRPRDSSKSLPSAQRAGTAEKQRSERRLPLVRALQGLYRATDAKESTLALSLETADEVALRRLASSSKSCAQALAFLRTQAVDREILAHLGSLSERDSAETSPATVHGGQQKRPPGTHESPKSRKRSRPTEDKNCSAQRRRIRGKQCGKAACNESPPPGACEPECSGADQPARTLTSAESLKVPLPVAAVKLATLSVPGVTGSVFKSVSPREEASLPARRVRLRSKGSACNAVGDSTLESVGDAIASCSSSVDVDIGGGKPATETLEELRLLPAKALRAELVSLGASAGLLRGLMEKDELCRLVLELRSKPKNAAASCSLSTVAEHAFDAPVNPVPNHVELHESRTPAGSPGTIVVSEEDARLIKLRAWSVRALKDMLKPLRPDLDLRTIVEKEELCRLLSPFLSS